MTDVDVASPYAEGDEREVEAALRPRRLADFVGQPRVREQLGLVLELRDRLGPAEPAAPAEWAARTPVAPWRDQVRHALVGLGWSAREAEDAVAAVAPDPAGPDADGAPDVPTLLRAALRVLSPR